MSARSFRSVFMVASCAGAALGCYLVSLQRGVGARVAWRTSRPRSSSPSATSALLQTEIGTRGRLAQLERWNVKVLALSAPSADQFLEGGFQLARLGRPEPTQAVEAPVVLASAPAPHPQSAPLEEGEPAADGAGASVPAAQLMREASLKIPIRETMTSQREPLPNGHAMSRHAGAKPARAEDRGARQAGRAQAREGR